MANAFDIFFFAQWSVIAVYFVRRFLQHKRVPSLALAALSTSIAFLALAPQSVDFVKKTIAFIGFFFLVSAIRVEWREGKK